MSHGPNQLIKRGLSPRVRRHLEKLVHGISRLRSISACAEAPAAQKLGIRQMGVYLRVCGGTTVRGLENPLA